MKENERETFSSKITSFSELYLSHHPICDCYKNHYFKIGPVYLCVGCTSFFSGSTIFLLLYFLLPTIFQDKPLVIIIPGFIGIILALIQLWWRPEKKIIKILLRFMLGWAMGAFFGLIILIPSWGWKFGLFAFLFPTTLLYNFLRWKSPQPFSDQCSIHSKNEPSENEEIADLEAILVADK